MLNSMTGFGRGVAQDGRYAVTVEMKAVNHRFLEFSLRQPKQLSMFEDNSKKLLQSRINRGKVDVFISLEYLAVKKIAVNVDKELALAYYNALVSLCELTGIDDTVSLRDLTACPGVLTTAPEEDDQDELWALLKQAMEDALSGFLAMRAQEGTALVQDLQAHLDTIEVAIASITTYAPQVVAGQKQRLEQRLSALLAEVEIDQGRLANELALFADRVDISEELARLGSHIAQFHQTLNAQEPSGRKLEFILQEMLRETNTIGSKSNGLEINQLVIQVKCELEKIREQIQNIE